MIELEKSNNEQSLRKVNMMEFLLDSKRYELRSGQEEEAPSCPYGNSYQWIGFDLKQKEYVRFTKSVFKKLIKNIGTLSEKIKL